MSGSSALQSLSSPSELAHKLYDQYKHNGIPINPLRIAEDRGIQVKKIAFNKVDIHGATHHKNGEIIIYVHEDNSTAQVRLTIAHLLGHCFLHPFPEGRGYFDTYTSLFSVHLLQESEEISKGSIELERQANVFAYCLLMPEEEIRYYWMLADDIYELATLFDLPVSHIRRRLKSLRLL